MSTVYDNIRKTKEVFAEDIEEAVSQYLIKEGVFTENEIEGCGMEYLEQYYNEVLDKMSYRWVTTKCLKIRLRGV
jgi:hypothetical protein